MNNDLSIALATLRSDPEDSQALARIASQQPGDASASERDAVLVALGAERAWHTDRENVEICLLLLDQELAWAQDPVRRATLFVEKARLLHREMCRWEPAHACADEALEISRNHPAAAELKRALDEEEAGWQERADTLVQQSKDAGETPAAASLLAAAGELYLRFRPLTDDGEKLLRRSLEQDPRQHRADVLLERFLRGSSRWKELATHFKRRIAAASIPQDQSAAHAAAGRLAEQSKRFDRALEHYREALALVPSNERALMGIGRLLGAREEWGEVAKLYEAALRSLKRGANEVPILVALGEIHWKNLNQMDQAEACFRRAKKSSPTAPAILNFYRDYHMKRDEVPQLFALLAQAQKTETDPDTRVRLGVEMAEMAERRPQLLEKAVDTWKGLLRLRPGLPEAVTALRRLYTKTEKWNALLELLKDRSESLPAEAVDEKVALLLEMVPIYRDHLRLEVMVVNTYTAILNLQPHYAEALSALAERYQAQGRWGDLANILSRQAQSAPDAGAKVALYHRVAQLWLEKFNNHHNAVTALEKVLELAPGDDKARTSLREIYTRARSWRALLDFMRRELPLLDGQARRDRLAEMAALASDRLADLRQAIALWNEVLELAPQDRDAAVALSVLYEREKRWPALAEILGRLAEAAGGDTTAEGCALLEKRGLILFEKLNTPVAAVEVLARVRRTQAENPRVLRALRDAYSQMGDFDALENLYASRSAWEELCEVFSQVAERTGDAAVRVRLLGRVAEIARDKLKQPERVLKAYEGILATDPGNRAVARAAAELYESFERWGRLLATYEILLGPESEPVLSTGESLAILERARYICETKLDAKSLAFKWCARAYRLAPSDPDVHADLERVGEAAEEWEALLGLLAARLETQGEQGPDAQERINLLRRCLFISGERVERPDDLKRFADQILALQPGDEQAETALLKLYMRGERWPELIVLQYQRQARVADPVLRAELLLRIARMQEEYLADRAAAAAVLREACEVEPRNLRLVRELARVLDAQGDTRSLVDVLRRESTLCADEEKAGVLLRMGRLLETALAQPGPATEAYLQALEVDPISAEAVEGLERLFSAGLVGPSDIARVAARLLPYYELTERFPKWAGMLEALIAVTESASERRPHLDLLADLYQGPLGDVPAAFGAVLRVFELEPGEAAVRERAIQLATDAGKLPALAESARKVLAATEQPGLRQELLIVLAEVETRQPERGKQAEAALREVLELDPLHGGAYRALARLVRDGERWSDLRDLIQAREKHVPEVKERLSLLWQAVEIDEALLYDRDHATELLRRITELEPKDLKACRVLERNYAAAERWRDLDDLLVHEVDLVPRDELPDLKLRRAELALVRFSQAGAALDLLADVLDLIPAHPRAVGFVERVLDDPEQRRRAAIMLEPIYTATENWARLVEILDIEREGQEGPAAVEQLVRKAQVQESKLQDVAAAWLTRREVLAQDPSSTTALAEAERLAGVLGRWQELRDLYHGLVDKRDASDIAGIADLLSRAAQLCQTQLNDRAAATTTWRRVLDLDLTSPRIGAAAAAALESLYAESGDIKGLVTVLRARCEWVDDQQARASVFLRIADLEENSLRDVPAAIATYRGLLDRDGDAGQQAFTNLERIFEKSGQSRERVELLHRRADSAEPELRNQLRHRMAAILEKELGDTEEAIATIRPVLDDTPNDMQALQTLARLYQGKGAAAEYLEILERLLHLAESPRDKVEGLRSIAKLLQGPLKRQADALDHWREILKLAPGEPEALGELERLLDDADLSLRFQAAETLEPVYRDANDGPRLARVLRIFIDLANDARARAGYRARLAEIEESKLGDKKAALATWAAAIRDGTSDPDLGRLLDQFERLALAPGAEYTIEIVELYRAVEPDVLAEETRLRLQRAVATHALALGDLPLAIDYLNRIVERRPDDDEALQSLETIYRQQENHLALYEVILRRADLAGTPVAETTLRREAGALANRLGRKDEAIASWERVWTAQPGDPQAVEALDTLYSELRRWDDLVSLLERRLERQQLTRDQDIDLRFRLANIQRLELVNRERALEYLGQVLERDPDHADSIKILQDLLEDPEARMTAATLLEPVYIRRSAWKELVGIDSLRLNQSEDPEQRLAWTRRIAQVYEEQIEDLDEAFNWYGRVFQEKATDRPAQEQLLRLAPKLGRWADLGKLLSEYLDNELSNSDDVLGLVRVAIRVYDHELGNREIAAKFYRRVLEAQPGNREAAEPFEEALERWEAWEELRDLLDEQSRLLEANEERIALLHRSARISQEFLSQPSAAVDALRAVLEIDPDDAVAAASLEHLLAADERWEELREHLVWMLGRADGVTAQDALTLELAEVEGKHLGRAMGAVDLYGEVLGRTPAHPNAIAALEGLLGDTELRPRVAELLEPAYRTTRNLRKLADILEVRLESIQDVARRVEALREKAVAENQLGRPGEALDALGRAWLEDVTDAPTLNDFESLATAAKAWERLVAILDKGIENTLSPDTRADLYARKARILEQRLVAPDRAIEAWNDAIAARPDFLEAHVALENQLQATVRMAELAQALERHAEVVVDAREREQLAKRVAVLYETTLRQPEKAILAWRSVLDLDQENLEALDALERLYTELADWSSLAEVLQRKIESGRDVATLRRLWFQSAQLYDQKLNDPSEAAQQLRSVLGLDPNDAEALEFLSQIYEREGKHAELVEILDVRAKSAKTPEQSDTLALQAAKLVQTELGDVVGAIGRYRAVLDRAPAQAAARAALWELARHEDYRAVAIAALEPVLRAGQEWPALVDLLELRLPSEDDPTKRLATLAEIARLQEQQLGKPSAAFVTWARALTEDPSDHGVRQALEVLAAQQGTLPDLAKIYEERLQAVFDTEVQRWLASRLANLYEVSLDNPVRAVELWREVAGMPGGEAEALGHLADLLRRLGRHQDLEEILIRQAEGALDTQAQADFWSTLGELRLQQLSDVDGAVDAFRAALERVPSQASALAALRALVAQPESPSSVLDILEPLAEARGDFAELTGLAQARLQRADDSGERAGLWRRIADLAETRLNDLPRALDALGSALKQDPNAFETADQIERVAERAGMPLEAARRLEAVIDALDGLSQAQIGLRAAHQYLLAGGQHESDAERLYARVLDIDPESTGALEALEALYRRRADAVSLAAILEKRGALELDPNRRLAYYGEAAGLHEQSGDLAKAIAAWQSGREGEESNLRALDELARLNEKAGRFEGLAEALTEKSHVVDDNAERAALYVRVGTLKAGVLSDLDGAAVAFREALDLQPDNPVALASLADTEERRGDFTALEEALLRQLTAAKGQASVPVLTRLAHNAVDRLNDSDRGLVYLHQVLDADTENRDAFVEMERILSSLERWHELIEVLERHADIEARTGHGDAELACRVSVARTWGEKLGASDSALEALQAVLARDPRHFSSLLAVAQIHENEERWAEAAEAVQRAAEVASSPSDRAALLCRMAKVRAATGSATEETAALYHSALDHDPHCMDAILALEAQVRAANSPRELIKLLETREALETDQTRRKAVLSEIATLYTGVLAAPDLAVAPLERLLKLSPEDLATQERLATALIKAGRIDEGEFALAQLAEQLGKARQPKQVARVQVLLGGFAQTRGNLALAKQRFLAAYQIDPTQVPTLVALANLASAQQDNENARKYYRTLLLQSFDEKAAGLSKSQIYSALGKLHMEASEWPKARNMFERGLEIDSQNEALRQALATVPK